MSLFKLSVVTTALVFTTPGIAFSSASATYSGTFEVETVDPIIMGIEGDKVPFAGVKEYDFEVSNETEICELAATNVETINSFDSANWKCHFEWEIGYDSIENLGTVFQGILPDSGDVDLPYSIYVYSGSNHERVTVSEGDYTLTVIDAIPPKLVDVEVSWGSEKLSDLEQFLGDPSSTLNAVKLTLEERPYNQKITFQGQSCVVAEGTTSCVIELDNEPLGGVGDYGQGQEVITLDSKTDYFQNNSETLSFKYDYRPVEFETIHINDNFDQSSKVVDIGGESLTLAFNQAAVVFTAHQSDLDNDWWAPVNPSVSFESDTGAQTNYLEVLGRSRFFEIPYFSRTREVDVSVLDRKLMGGQLVQIYDITEVSDGNYTALIDAKNAYDVGESFTSDMLTLSRYEPAIGFFTSRSTVTDSVDIYFASDLAIAAFSGWDDGTRIESVAIDGSPVEFKGSENIVHISESAIESLQPGSTYELTAVAENSKGARSDRTITFTYADAEYEFRGAPETLFRKVEALNLNVRQTKGPNCNFVTSKEMAQLAATQSRYGCYAQWAVVPDGMIPEVQGRSPRLSGVVNTPGDSVSIAFDVIYVNQAGHTTQVPGSEVTIDLLEPNPIDLGFNPHQETEAGVVVLPDGERNLGLAMIKFNRGVVDYEIAYDGVEPHSSRALTTSREETEGTIMVRANQEVSHNLYEERQLTIKAWYRYAPDMEAVVTRNLMFIPSEKTRFSLTSDSMDGHSLEDMGFQVTLEALANRQWSTDPDRIGDYDVHLAIQESRDAFTPITEPVTIVDGKAEFTLDLDQALSIGANQIVAIADLKSPEEAGFGNQLISRRISFYLYSGEAVEGQLVESTLQGPIPMRARLSFQANTFRDSRLIDEYRWEVSNDDGSTWEVSDEFTGAGFSPYHLEPADYLVRATVKNRLTQLEYTSEPVRIIAYDQPRIIIEGPGTIYSNVPETYKITRRYEEMHDDEGKFFWSYDGEDWFEGEREITIDTDQSFRLYGKFESNSVVGRELEREGTSETQRSVRVRDPRPIRLSANLPRYAEEGESFILEGITRPSIRQLDYPIESEWVASDGSVFDNMHEYLVTADDINADNSADFTLRAWIPGMREDTYNEQVFTTRPWSYATPSIDIEKRTSHQIAPVSVRMAIHHEAIFAPGIDIEYDWDIPVGAEITREYTGSREIVAEFNEPGVYEIKATLTDSRGGERVTYEYLEILEPAEMEPTMDVRFSGEHMRPPITAVTKLSVERTHPDDRISEIRWYLDGEEIGDPRTTGVFELTGAGAFDLTGEVHTRLGQVAQVTETVTLVPNKPPVCEPEHKETEDYHQLFTNCEDEDGKLVRFEWYWNDQESNRNRSNLTFSKRSWETMEVQFRAYDDSGDYYEGSFSW